VRLEEEGSRRPAASATGVAPPSHQAFVEDAPEETEDVKEEPDRVRSGNPSPSIRAPREDGADVVDLTSDGSQEPRAPGLRAARSVTVAPGVPAVPSVAPTSEYPFPDT
jgi:hypothetical protein